MMRMRIMMSIIILIQILNIAWYFFEFPNLIQNSGLASGLFLVFHDDLDGYECQILFLFKFSILLGISLYSIYDSFWVGVRTHTASI